MPHQLCREYIFGIFASLWNSKTAAKPEHTERARQRIRICLAFPYFTHANLSLTYDADDQGEQVNDAVKQLYVPLRLILKHSVDQDSWRERARRKFFLENTRYQRQHVLVRKLQAVTANQTGEPKSKQN